ncbi:MAG: ATP-binding cassette domain-containing protein [Clostridia bacterium]|nr:ATP-binding cassette domain-containing protein [Clostridia bacterium]
MGNWFDEASRLKRMLDSAESESAVSSQINVLEDALRDLKASLAGGTQAPARDSHFNYSHEYYAGDRPAVITTKGITKTYGDYNANDGVSITVKKGSIYGLVGRNGAGKTTWMKIVLGLTKATSGTVELAGGEINEVRRRIGFMIESPAFYDNLTAYQNLVYRAKLIELDDPERAIDEALEKVGIPEKKNAKVKTFSLGQKQLLGIAAAIMGDPETLILDEPVNGLDPVAIVKIRNLLLDMNKKGVTIVISSHILGELQKLATCYGFILEGKLVKELSEADVMNGDVNIEDLFVSLAKGELS